MTYSQGTDNNTNRVLSVLRSALTLTGGGCDGGEGHVSDVPLPADGGPGREAHAVVLHHQREGVPGEVRAQVLTAHHHPAAAPQALGDAEGEGEEG